MISNNFWEFGYVTSYSALPQCLEEATSHSRDIGLLLAENISAEVWWYSLTVRAVLTNCFQTPGIQQDLND